MSDHNGKERAQGLVEFALVLPILLVLMMGLIEFGRLLFIYSAAATASREAVRYGSAAGENPGGTPYYMDCAGMQEAAMRLGSLAGIQSGNVVVQYDRGPSTAFFSACPVSSPDDIVGGVDRVVVSVTATFTPLGTLANFPSFPVSSQSARTVIKGIQVSGNTATPGATALPTATGTTVATATATDVVLPTATNTSIATATATDVVLPTATNTTAPTPPAPVNPVVDSDKGSPGNKCS